MTSVVGRTMASKDVSVLIPRTCDYVVLHGNRDLADVIQLRILRRGDYPGLLRWAENDHKCPYRKQLCRRVRGRIETWPCYVAGVEDGGRSHEPRNAGGP